MSDDNLYYSKSKNKYIKIAEMPDQHVRRAFIQMNKDKGLIQKFLNWDLRIKIVRDSLNSMLEEIEEALGEKKDKD